MFTVYQTLPNGSYNFIEETERPEAFLLTFLLAIVTYGHRCYAEKFLN